MTNPLPTLARSTVLTVLLGTAAALAAAPAGARDRALIIANEEYPRYDDIDLDGELRGTRDAIAEAGFEVDISVDADLAAMLDALDRFAGDVRGEDDARVVLLLGQFVRVGGGVWMLGFETDGVPGIADLPLTAIPVDLIAAVLERESGPVALLLGGEVGDRPEDDVVTKGLHPAIPPRDLRVPLITGAPDDVMEAARLLARPGAALGPRELKALDLLSRRVGEDGIAIMAGDRTTERPRRPVQVTASEAEENYWEVVERFDNRTGYEAYLRRFPEGRYARIARDRLGAIAEDPLQEARRREADLNLSPEDRRAAQSDLVLLGFDTRGVDGVFGEGSRAAITAWQARNGYEDTGFLTGEQVRVLDAQGARRQAELDAERERRRAEAEREDREYWDRVAADGSADGLRRYLERFPDGIYAGTAEARLDAMAVEARSRASAQDRETWLDATDRDRPGAYRRYLRDNPDGAYRDAAAQRLRELTGRDDDDGEERRLAAEAEQRLGLDQAGRRLVESGLESFGLEPGAVDGEFDRQTRRALRRYQEERGLPVTGFMSQDIVVRMLAERILR